MGSGGGTRSAPGRLSRRGRSTRALYRGVSRAPRPVPARRPNHARCSQKRSRNGRSAPSTTAHRRPSSWRGGRAPRSRPFATTAPKRRVPKRWRGQKRGRSRAGSGPTASRRGELAMPSSRNRGRVPGRAHRRHASAPELRPPQGERLPRRRRDRRIPCAVHSLSSELALTADATRNPVDLSRRRSIL